MVHTKALEASEGEGLCCGGVAEEADVAEVLEAEGLGDEFEELNGKLVEGCCHGLVQCCSYTWSVEGGCPLSLWMPVVR